MYWVSLLLGTSEVCHTKVTAALLFRVSTVIGKVASEISDPCVLCHWSSTGTSSSSSATVHITSAEVPDLSRCDTSFSLWGKCT